MTKIIKQKYNDILWEMKIDLSPEIDHHPQLVFATEIEKLQHKGYRIESTELRENISTFGWTGHILYEKRNKKSS